MSGALVFHIIHGSFVDGYGIRTTVFLKGCPLRCIWCCNPEGQSFSNELKVNPEECDLCGRCVKVCKRQAISVAGGHLAVNRKLCCGCMECTQVCYSGALEPFARFMEAGEVFEEIKKDKKFYDATGGGATIGGGECSAFPEFLSELTALCHSSGIHVAADTCGYTLSEKSLKALETADLLLFDIKGLDSAKHLENTGVSNELILKNLRHFSDIRKPMIIRIPVIPGYNGSNEELEETAKLLSQLKTVERIDIIPEHEFGKVKYAQLGKAYTLKAQAVSEQRQEEIKRIFESRGFKTQIGG